MFLYEKVKTDRISDKLKVHAEWEVSLKKF